MPARHVYIRLLPGELDLLAAMAREERRSPQDQAAHLVALGLRRWRAEHDFAASLVPDSGLAEDQEVRVA